MGRKAGLRFKSAIQQKSVTFHMLGAWFYSGFAIENSVKSLKYAVLLAGFSSLTHHKHRASCIPFALRLAQTVSIKPLTIRQTELTEFSL